MRSITLNTCKSICIHRLTTGAINNENPHKRCPIRNICANYFTEAPCKWRDDIIAQDTIQARKYIKGEYDDE